MALAPILDAIIGGAHELMEKYQVPVMLEFILERGTNISMGTEIDGVNEFEEILWLDPKLSIKKDRVDGCRSWAKLSCGAGNPAGWRGLPGGGRSPAKPVSQGDFPVYREKTGKFHKIW